MNQTFVCCSTYHVYISILEAYKFQKEGGESVLFFFDDLITDIEPFLQNVEKLGLFKDVVRIKGYTILRNMKKNFGFWRYVTDRPAIIRGLYHEHNDGLVRHQEFIRNSQINLFQINRTRAYFILEFPNNFFRMYEDGYGTYTQRLGTVRRLRRKYITKLPMLKGHDSQIKEVWVSYPEKVTDKVLIPKLRKLDITVLEDQLTQAEKQNIVHSLIGGVVLNREASVTLVITQPLSEDSICTESTKIKLYNNIVSQERALGKIVYFKSHPREVTQYHFDDPGVLFLPKYFPMEVFNLDQSLGVDKAVAYFSTALYNLKHVQDKVLLGEDFLRSEVKKIESQSIPR